MEIIDKALQQQAVYWPNTGSGPDGLPILGEAVEIKCRWEDFHGEIITAQGRIVVSNAIVMVDRDVTVGGVLWLGTLEDVQYQMDAKRNQGAYEIVNFGKTPTLDAKKALREAYL